MPPGFTSQPFNPCPNNARAAFRPWSVKQIPGGYKVLDANGKSLAYVYGRETKADADIARVLTMDETRRIASNVRWPQA
jgi:hypothetical protein